MSSSMSQMGLELRSNTDKKFLNVNKAIFEITSDK